MLPFAIGAAKIAGGFLGGEVLQAIGEAIAGSPTESQAKERVAPLFNRAVDRLTQQGMSLPEATKAASQEVEGHVQEEMGKGNLPEWASMALNLAGFAGGAVAVGKGLGKYAAKELTGAKAASVADAATIDPLKAKAAGAIADDSGKAVDAIKSNGPFPPNMRGSKEYAGERGAGREAWDQASASNPAPGPARSPFAPKRDLMVRDAEFTEIPGAADEIEAGLSAARQGGSPFPRLGMSVREMPTDVTEERLMQNIKDSRGFRGRDPGYQKRELPRLPLNEDDYINGLMRNGPQGF